MINKILLNYNNLNEKEKEFITWFKNLDKSWQIKNIKDIAENYGVGISFIYNLINKLDIKSFKEFIIIINLKTEILNNDLFDIIKQKNKDIHAKTLELITQSNLANYQILNNQKVELKKVVDFINNSKNIKGLGFGHSFIALQEFQAFYKHINSKFTIHNSNNFYSSEDQTTFIIFSTRSKNNNLTNAIKKIRQNKLNKIILFTSNKDSKVAKECDYVIEFFNTMSLLNLYSEPYYLTPLVSWSFVTSILKSIFFEQKKNSILNDDESKFEIDSWEKGSYF